MGDNGTPEYYDKLWALIEAAKTDPALRGIMKAKNPWNKIEKLKEYGFTDSEVTALQDDLGAITDETSLSWWSF